MGLETDLETCSGKRWWAGVLGTAEGPAEVGLGRADTLPGAARILKPWLVGLVDSLLTNLPEHELPSKTV